VKAIAMAGTIAHDYEDVRAQLSAPRLGKLDIDQDWTVVSREPLGSSRHARGST
jgi:hypothetical protein